MPHPKPLETGSIELTVRAAYVYRAWSETGDLLYVGLTDNVVRRIGEHLRAHAPWVADHATTVTWERYATMEDAARIEWTAIRRERPRHNLSGNTAVVNERLDLMRRGHRRRYNDEDWRRLGAAVRARRGELHQLSQTRAAAAAGARLEAWRALERGEGATLDTTAAGYAAIENTLDWMPGSVEQVLSATAATPLTAEARSARIAAFYEVRG